MTAPVLLFRSVAPVDDGWLTPRERDRRDRLQVPEDRAAFTAAHLLVRECAALLLGVGASRLVVEQHCPGCGSDGHGRPSIQAHPDVHVSLSHTRGWVAAIAAHRPCGIDVEARRTGPPVRRALTEREEAWVERRSDPGAAFTRLWVRKEALVKAGACAPGDLGALEVLGADGPADRVGGFQVAEWSGAGHVGASAFTRSG